MRGQLWKINGSAAHDRSNVSTRTVDTRGWLPRRPTWSH